MIVANNAKLYRGEQVIVRSMALNERAVWEKLWNDYLSFYETELSGEVKNVTWARLHDPNEPMYLLAACLGGHVVGIVHYLFHRSCWTLGNYCYLQDLFVDPQARGLGVIEHAPPVQVEFIGLRRKTTARPVHFMTSSRSVRASFSIASSFKAMRMGD